MVMHFHYYYKKLLCIKEDFLHPNLIVNGKIIKKNIKIFNFFHYYFFFLYYILGYI